VKPHEGRIDFLRESQLKPVGVSLGRGRAT
jgi:hypothetical protein